MADSIPSAEAVVLILTSCTVWQGPPARWSEIRRPGGQFRGRQVEHAVRGGLGQLDGPGARRRPGPPGPPRARAAAAAAVDEYPVDRVGRRVERGLHPGKAAERIPPGLVRD